MTRTIEEHALEHKLLLGENLDQLDLHRANLEIILEELELVDEYVATGTKIKKDVEGMTSQDLMGNLLNKLKRDTKRRDELRKQRDALKKLIVLIQNRVKVHRKVLERYEK